MNRKLIYWLVALALAGAPVLSAAQEGPGPDEDEVEMNDGGPGPGGPGMGPGGPGPRGQMGPGREGGPGMKGGKRGWDDESEDGPARGERMIVRKKMMMRGDGEGFFPEEKILATIRKHDAEFARKLEQLQEAAPGKYRMILMMSGKMLMVARMEGDEALEKDAVRGLALEFESKELSMKYAKADDAGRKEIKARLGKVLAELFDLKTKGQELRVKKMEGELGGLRKKIENRKANKAKIVDQRLEQLTGEGYGW